MMTLTLSEAKNSLSAVIDDVERFQERVEITRNGHPVAYLVSAEEMVTAREMSFWRSQPGVLTDVTRTRDERAAGAGYTTEQVRTWVEAGMPKGGPTA